MPLDIISKQYKSGVCLAWPGGWQQSGTARIYNVCVGRDQVGGGEGGVRVAGGGNIKKTAAASTL